MTSRRLSRHLQLLVTVPKVEIRRRTTAAPAPGSREGSTGTPRRTVRVDDALWGAAMARAVSRRQDLSSLIRGWLAAYVRGELDAK